MLRAAPLALQAWLEQVMDQIKGKCLGFINMEGGGGGGGGGNDNSKSLYDYSFC